MEIGTKDRSVKSVPFATFAVGAILRAIPNVPNVNGNVVVSSFVGVMIVVLS